MGWRGALLLLLAGAGSWFAWGAAGEARYRHRLEALRAAGEPVVWADLFVPAMPEPRNGASALLAADETFHAFERELLEMEDLGPDGAALVPWWDADEPWSPAEREAAVEAVERLAPYFARLDAALAYPVLERATEGPFGESLWGAVQNAIQQCELEARVDSSRWTPSLDRSLRLLSRWRDRTGMKPWATFLWRAVLRNVGEALRKGHLADPEPRAAWDTLLAAEAGRLATSVEGTRRARLASILWTIEAWAEGRDPAEPLARELRSLGALPGMQQVREENAGLDRFLTNVARWADGFTRMPAIARWWARPCLWYRASEMLDRWEARRATDLSSPARIRHWLEQVRHEPGAGTPEHASFDTQILLHHTATLHLARLALAVHDAGLATGRLPSTLEEVAGRLADGVPTDPLTGEAFHYAVVDGEAVLQTDPDGVLIALLLRVPDACDDELRKAMVGAALRWRVPGP